MNKKFLLISIKPEFANKIVDNNKSIELRKSRPNAQPGDFVLLYSTQPKKAVIGFAKIKRIIESSPNDMWLNNSQSLGIDKKRYNDYYSGYIKAIGIELSGVCKFKFSISLTDIKSAYPKFSPPQTYKYISCYSALKFYKEYLAASGI